VVAAVGVCVIVAFCVTVILRVGFFFFDAARSPCVADVVTEDVVTAVVDVVVLATADFLVAFLAGLFFFGFFDVVD